MESRLRFWLSGPFGDMSCVEVDWSHIDICFCCFLQTYTLDNVRSALAFVHSCLSFLFLVLFYAL